MALSREETAQRKRAFRAKERADYLAALPYPPERLEPLFVFLDGRGCRDDLAGTTQWCQAHGLEFARLEPWLNDNGAYCDCETVLNVWPWMQSFAESRIEELYQEPTTRNKTQSRRQSTQ